MAVKKFNTRIQLKRDSSTHFDSFTPLAGELLVVTDKNNVKIGNGTTGFGSLPYLVGGAVLASYTAPTSSTTGAVAATDTLDQALAKLQKGINDAAAGGVLSIGGATGTVTLGNGLQSTTGAGGSVSAKTTGYIVANAGSNTDSIDIDSSKIDDDYTVTNTTDLATVATVTSALGTLTDTLTGTPGAGNTVTAFDEVDGKVTATFAPISITASQISDASTNLVTSVKGDGTYLSPDSATHGDVTISHKTRTEAEATGTAQNIKVTDDNQSISIITHTFDAAGHETGKTTTAVNFTKITAADLGLSSAMHFIGTSTTDPTSAGGPTVSGHTAAWEAGDVVLFGTKEYVFDGTNWTELGDEGSYAQKTIILTAGNGLTGGGTLEANRTFAIDIDPTNANGLYLSGSTDGSKQLAMHTATDSQFGTVTATTGNGLTLSNGNLSYAHNTTAITVASKDASTNVITINGTLTPDASDAITASNSIALAAVAATGDAADVSYDNTTSGLTASTVQAAIDEIKTTAAGAVQDVKSIVTTATTAQNPDSEAVEGSGNITLHKIAKTANPADLIQPTGDLIIFDCGSASVNTADETGAIAPNASTPNA